MLGRARALQRNFNLSPFIPKVRSLGVLTGYFTVLNTAAICCLHGHWLSTGIFSLNWTKLISLHFHAFVSKAKKSLLLAKADILKQSTLSFYADQYVPHVIWSKVLNKQKMRKKCILYEYLFTWILEKYDLLK